MQIQKVNSSQTNQNFEGLMLRLSPTRIIDSGKVSRIIEKGGKIVLTLSDSNSREIEFKPNYSAEEVALIVQEAARNVVVGGVRLINGLIDLVGEHLNA